MADALERHVHKAAQSAPVRLADDRARRRRRRDRRRRATATAAVTFADTAVRAVPPTPALGDWKMGILADGLIASRMRVTPDAGRSRDWLVQYADALLRRRRRRSPIRATPLPLGYWRSSTGDDALSRRRPRSPTALPIGDWGKTLAIVGPHRLPHPRRRWPRRGPAATPAPAAPPPRVGARTATTVTVARSACPAFGSLKSAAHGRVADLQQPEAQRLAVRPLQAVVVPDLERRGPGGSRSRGMSRTSSGCHTP